MITARTTLHDILLNGTCAASIDASALEARAIVDRFKAETVMRKSQSPPANSLRGEMLRELADLRDAVDHEVDRRIDADITDNVCDLLEQLSIILHEETSTPDERRDAAF
jgi:hypothetical protein